MKGKKKEELGIRYQASVRFLEEKKSGKWWIPYGFGTFVFVIYLIAMAECLVSGVGIICDQRLLLAGLSGAGIVFYTGFHLRKGGEWVIGGALFAYAGASVWFREYISVGFAIILNHMSKLIESYYGMAYAEYQVEEHVNKAMVTTCFLLFVFVFLAGIMSYFLVNSVANYIGLGLAVLVALIPEMVGLVPDHKWLAVFTSTAMIYLAGGKRSFGRKKEDRSREQRLKWKVRVLQLVICVVSVLFLFQVIPQKSYDARMTDTSFKNAMQLALEDLYDHTLRKALDTGKVKGGLNFGELSGLGKIEFDDKPKLSLTAASGFRTEKIYLKGFVGTNYESSKWNAHTKEQEQVLQRLEKEKQRNVEDYVVETLEYHQRWGAFFTLGMKSFSANMKNYLCEAAERDRERFHGYVTTAYEPELYAKQLWDMENNFSIEEESISEVYKVKNLGETVSTIFQPYGVLGSASENGKLWKTGVKDGGSYSWNISLDDEEKFNADQLYSVEDGSGNIGKYGEHEEAGDTYTAIDGVYEIWKPYLESKSYIEKALGISLLDYQPGQYKGASVEAIMPDIQEELQLEEDDRDRACVDLVQFIEHYYRDAGDEESWGSVYDFANWEEEGKAEWEKFRGKRKGFSNVKEGMDADAFLTLMQNMYRFYLQQQEYENFVKGEYCRVPEGLEKKLSAWKKAEGLDGNESELEKIVAIRKYLSENTKYSLSPGVTPGNKDFVEYFLFENKKGFCVHYASAATMMLRSLGVPTRYVEGYVASSLAWNHAKREAGGKGYTITLSDRDAHAWVEVYLYGYGWFPVEVTNGHYTMELEDTVEEAQGIKEEGNIAPKATVQPADKTSEPKTTTEPIVTGEASSSKIDARGLLYACMACLGVVGVIVFAVIVQRLQKKQQATQKEFNARVYFYYKEMEKLLGLWNKDYKCRELRKSIQMGIALSGIEQEEWNRLLDKMNRSAFSKNGADEDLAKEVMLMHEKVKLSVYRELSWCKRVLYWMKGY